MRPKVVVIALALGLAVGAWLYLRRKAPQQKEPIVTVTIDDPGMEYAPEDYYGFDSLKRLWDDVSDV